MFLLILLFGSTAGAVPFNVTINGSQSTITASTQAPWIPPSIDPSTPSDYELVEGENITLACKAHGSPTPHIHWRRQDGKMIRIDGKEVYGTTAWHGSEMELNHVLLNHKATYVCIASNTAGDDATWGIKLNVLARPCEGLSCEHGGILSDSTCKCACPYGFGGERCELLKRNGQFNDANCGVIDAKDSGNLSLSTYPGTQKKGTFCQWLVQSSDPWAKIELSFESLDMDNHDLPPGTICNDILSIYGAGVAKIIPCDGSTVPAKLTSTSNWVLVELRTSPWATEAPSGPRIRYNVIRSSDSDEEE